MDDLEQKRWLRERIYRPKERVRARQLATTDWEIFDGVTVVTVNNEYFKETYMLSACDASYNRDNGQYEYHSD